MSWARILVAGLLAVAAAVMVVRNALVAVYADANPVLAEGVWPGHPEAVFRAGLIRIGEAAAAGRPVGGEVIDPLLAAARSAPLAPEPYLVRGVQLRVGGDEAGAGRAFAQAKRRDPRSIPARFFLADHYLRSGSIEPGLAEVAGLTRLVPGSESWLAPILAGYAKTPGAVPHVKAMLRSHPELEPGLLAFLAADAANADLIFALASDGGGSTNDRPAWQVRLVERLARASQYDRSYAVWARLMGRPASPRPLLFDPRFEQLTAMRPFGWTLASGSAGLVEPEQGGLHVIYYGRESVTMASQLLLLSPGRYELAMRVANGGDGAESLAWTISCFPRAKPIFSIDLAKAAAAAGSGHLFDIPAGCGAQRLELVGSAPEYPKSVDLTLSRLSLSRVDR